MAEGAGGAGSLLHADADSAIERDTACQNLTLKSCHAARYDGSMVRRPALALVTAIIGCSSGSSDGGAQPTADAGDSAVIGCAANPLAQTWAPNLTRAGELGALQFVLVDATPAPPLRGDNTWKVKLLTAAGAAVSGATVEAVPFMPEHGHGTSVEAVATANADGTFTVAPLNLFMPGLWRVTLTAKAGTVTDTASFHFCVAG